VAAWVAHGFAPPGRPWRRRGAMRPFLHDVNGALPHCHSQSRPPSSSGRYGGNSFELGPAPASMGRFSPVTYYGGVLHRTIQTQRL
jgi:hypothetical protein